MAKKKQALAEKPPEEVDWVTPIGKPTYENIAEMVAALECDYERLEELRDEREALADAEKEARENYFAFGFVVAEDVEGEEASDKIDKSLNEAVAALEAWDAENAEELKELTEAAGECESEEDARRRIEEDPLSIEWRSGWTTPGHDMEPEEFCILLGTGGPATRIRGELGQHNEPSLAWLEVQDWFKPWTEYVPADQEVLLKYARVFCWEV